MVTVKVELDAGDLELLLALLRSPLAPRTREAALLERHLEYALRRLHMLMTGA